MVPNVKGLYGYSQEKILKPGNHPSIDDMELITTIGIGAFGRVELVRPIGDETRSFALKKMAKFRIVEQDQQEHIKNEKNLLMTLNNDFIVKCYQSFR